MATVKQPIALDLQVSCVESYTPAPGAITSTQLGGKTLSYAFFQTSADCNITVTCLMGNSQVIAVKGGIPYPYAVTKITNISTGNVYILHNGY